MKIINNLNEAKDLAIGEHFIFGEYQGEPIEWRKIDKHLAISEKILDCIVFNRELNNKYDESMMRKWCNDTLGKALKLSEDTLYVLYEEEMLSYFPTDESRQAEPTEWAIMHGIYVNEKGKSSYWTASPVSSWFYSVRTVYSSGLFSARNTYTSDVGVRPVLKIWSDKAEALIDEFLTKLDGYLNMAMVNIIKWSADNLDSKAIEQFCDTGIISKKDYGICINICKETLGAYIKKYNLHNSKRSK